MYLFSSPLTGNGFYLITGSDLFFPEQSSLLIVYDRSCITLENNFLKDPKRASLLAFFHLNIRGRERVWAGVREIYANPYNKLSVFGRNGRRTKTIRKQIQVEKQFFNPPKLFIGAELLAVKSNSILDTTFFVFNSRETIRPRRTAVRGGND